MIVAPWRSWWPPASCLRALPPDTDSLGHKRGPAEAGGGGDGADATGLRCYPGQVCAVVSPSGKQRGCFSPVLHSLAGVPYGQHTQMQTVHTLHACNGCVGQSGAAEAGSRGGWQARRAPVQGPSRKPLQRGSWPGSLTKAKGGARLWSMGRL